MVFIYISLIAKDLEHFDFLAIFTSFQSSVFGSVAQFFNWVICSLSLCFFRTLYSLGINPLTNVYIAGHNSLPPCEFLLHSNDYFLCCTEVSQFYKVPFVNY